MCKTLTPLTVLLTASPPAFWKAGRAGHPQAGSLAGAARLLKRNAGVPKQAQAGRKPAVEQKSKGLSDPPRQCRGGPRKRGLSILYRAGARTQR